jgi:hypothetical protein
MVKKVRNATASIGTLVIVETKVNLIIIKPVVAVKCTEIVKGRGTT